MHRRDGGRERAHLTTTIDSALQLLASYDPEPAEQLGRALRGPGVPEARHSLRESLAEALFEHDRDEPRWRLLTA
jgi:hypothetical protein